MESDIQQPAGFLCKKLKPGQQRREAPFFRFAKKYQNLPSKFWS